MSGCIYRITCTANGKVYFGSTINYKKRKRDHFNCLKTNSHPNKNMQASYIKHGEGSFNIEILVVCEPSQCLAHEQVFIDQFWDNGHQCFNVLPTAGSPRGYTATSETREAQSLVAKRRGYCGENIELMAIRNKGNKYRLGSKASEKTRRKMSETRRGKSISTKGRPWTEARRKAQELRKVA